MRSDNTPNGSASLKLLLFDIDGTLLLSGGAGKAAMERAFDRIWGLRDALQDTPLMGRTDPSIVLEVLKKSQIPPADPDIEKFREYYFWFLEEELDRPRPGKALCPGILPLLSELREMHDIELGLLTGNWRYGGLLKLRHFGIDGFFSIGAFADDSMKREDLVPIAMDRYSKTNGRQLTPDSVFVIGDTPFDIQCGKPHHVRTVAVATGVHLPDELKAENPDFFFNDLSRTEDVLRVFDG